MQVRTPSYPTLFSSAVKNLEATVSVTIPEIVLNQAAQMAKDDFAKQLQTIAQPLNAKNKGAICAIAPLGGTKITAFKELNLDGLAIVDWDRTGSSQTIKKTFVDAPLRVELIAALDESLNNGSMNTGSVMRAAISPQIISRLWYELGVSSVRVQFYLPQQTEQQAWDGPTLEDNDVTLVTRYLFTYREQPKELVYVSAKITADTKTWRHALPLEVLQNLAPQKFQWSYLCADGLIFFSQSENNGLHKGNQELLDLLAEDGRVVLDYPHAAHYNGARPQVFDGIEAMCGRGDLEKWGLQAIGKIPANKQVRVFGYSGEADEDEIRVYAKTGVAPVNIDVPAGEIFSVQNLQKVGEDVVFDLHGEKALELVATQRAGM